MPSSSYPKAKTSDQTDLYHGVAVADPYRWMEDVDTPDVQAWIAAENEITSQYLQSIPEREAIAKRLAEVWNYERYGVPEMVSGQLFFTKNDGLQNQSVFYTMTPQEPSPRVLLDPNTLSDDGTVALTGLSVSEDAKMLAYGLASSGSDWQTYKVRDIETGEDLADEVRWVKFSGATWTNDGAGFYYARFAEPKEETLLQDANFNQMLYYHRVGTPQASDPLIYQRPDEKEWMYGTQVSEDGAFLIISIRRDTAPKNAVLYQHLVSQGEITALIPEFEAMFHFIGNDGPVLYFHTELNAPKGRIIAIDTNQPEREHWREIVSESDDTLEGVALFGDTFILSYLKDAHASVQMFSTSGETRGALALPGLGSVGGFTGRRTDTETYYAFTSFTQPTTIYHLDLVTNSSRIYRQPELDIDLADYTTEQVFYTSKDGTRVPMFISHKRGIVRNGANPTYLYGYGGFGASLTPSFSPANAVWMGMGGILAIPNLRGGGEYGEEWHQAGTKLKKQNVFDDFIAAAEYLIAEKYTSTPKLAISGGSNGGLLVGACMAQRPELFGAALPAVGVMDMLRFPKFTIGWAWMSDYGSPENPDEFAALYAYSPLHNLKPGVSYPATLVTTADHDDRVVPAHSFKFTAALQAAQSGPAPALIRIETKAGHGAGKPTAKMIEEIADKWAFLTKTLGMNDPGDSRQ